MNSVVYEFWASISGLEPAEVFTLEQHQAEVFGQRVGESLYQAARRVIGPTGSVQELNAFFIPYVDYTNLNELLEVFTDTGVRFYNSQRTTVRENLVVNPRMQTADNWVYAGNGGVANFITSAAFGTQVDYVSDNPSNNHILYQNAVMPITGGDVVSGSYEIEVPVGYPAATFQVRINSYGGTTLTSIGQAVTVQPGQTTTITTNPLVTSAENTGFRVILQTNGAMAAGSRFFVRNSLAEKAATPGPYFDGSTPAKIARNLNTNSSFEFGSGTVAVRQNYVPDPNFVSGAWGITGATSVPFDGGIELTTTGDTAGNFLTGTAVNGLTRVSASWFVENTGTTQFAVQARVWDDVAYLTGETANLAPGESRYVKVENVTVAGTYAQPRLWKISPTPAGAKLRVSKAIMEAERTTGEFFDGNTTPDTDMAPSWLGAVNNSSSVLYATMPSSYATSANVARGIKSSKWKTSGEVSLRQIPLYGIRGSAYTEFATHASTLGMQPGKTYTVRADFYQEQPQPFPSTGNYRAILAALTPYSVQAPNVAGQSQVKLLFTVPTSGSWYLRLYNGGMYGDPDVWWDSLMIVEGDYDGPYFDGAIRPKGLASAWEGTEYLSPSYLYDPQYTVTWSGAVDNSTSLMVKYND